MVLGTRESLSFFLVTVAFGLGDNVLPLFLFTLVLIASFQRLLLFIFIVIIANTLAHIHIYCAGGGIVRFIQILLRGRMRIGDQYFGFIFAILEMLLLLLALIVGQLIYVEADKTAILGLKTIGMASLVAVAMGVKSGNSKIVLGGVNTTGSFYF